MKPLYQFGFLGAFCTLVLAMLGASTGPWESTTYTSNGEVPALELLLPAIHQPVPSSDAKTIVVQAFEVAPNAIQLDKAVQGVPDLLSELQLHLESSLVAHGKFRVLDSSPPPPAPETTSASKSPVDGAQAIPVLQPELGVSCRIEQLSVQTLSEVVKLTGYVSRTRVANVELTLTLHSKETGAILWTLPYAKSVDTSPEDLRAEDPPMGAGLIARALLYEATGVLARELTLRYFPVRVVRIQTDAPRGAAFSLNVGSTLHSVGDKFELVRLGDAILDPQTGDPIGRVEHPLGVLRIVDQDEKLSRAHLMDPSPEQSAYFGQNSLDLEALECRAIPSR
jgi:hypothetical protein